MSEIDFKTLSRAMSGREGLAGSTILVTIAALIAALVAWALASAGGTEWRIIVRASLRCAPRP